MEHKHLIVRAEVKSPPTDEMFIKTWLVDLVDRVGMNIAAGPISSYVTKEGNEGLTATVLIETSHIVIHVWDKYNPPLIQFDLYSCGAFNVDDVALHFSVFEPTKIEYKYLNRDEKLTVLDEGRIENGGDRFETRLDNNGVQQYPF